PALAIYASEQERGHVAKTGHLPRRPGCADPGESRPQTAMDQGKLASPEPNEQHIGVGVERFANLVDQLTCRMSPPGPRHADSRDDGDEGRHVLVCEGEQSYATEPLVDSHEGKPHGSVDHEPGRRSCDIKGWKRRERPSRASPENAACARGQGNAGAVLPRYMVQDSSHVLAGRRKAV